ADPPAYPADPFAADPSAPPPADPFATGPPARATTAQDPAGTTSPSAFTPAVGPADATGPMPLAIPPASATETTQPPAAPPATGPRTPPVEAEPVASVPEASASETTVESVPGTGAWSFAPPASSSGGDAWSFTGERSSGRTQSWPLPAPGGAAHAGASRQSEAPATGRSRKRVAWPLTLVGVLVAVAAGIALTVTLARAEPDELITAAATDVGGWNGVRYQGAVAAADGGRIRFDLTVTVDGATGTLSRDDGQATAEIHRDGSGTVVRANRTWWLYHHPTRADDLANTWVADPLTETQEIEPILQLHPYALASHVRPEQQRAQWTALEEQQVDGRDALVLSDGTRRVVVAAAAPHQLLAVDIGPTGALAPVQVSDVPSEEAAGVGRAAGEIREAEAPKTLTQRLLERPLVEITLEPEPLCVTPSCTVTVTVTNSGSIPAEGRLEVSADGTLVATHPLDVQPGQVATFTATAPNPQFATPGAKGQILWESRAVDD
ncbi:MAG TPA: hypothetical protein VD903_24255, partial [Pseudonocardia sp.]|nr:hypothetical protein [Pseudonocardia sp.]